MHPGIMIVFLARDLLLATVLIMHIFSKATFLLLVNYLHSLNYS